MLLLAAAALGLTTSAGTGYYIYQYHPEHFKEIIFNRSVETYTTIRTTSSSLYSSAYRTIMREDPPSQPKIEITDLKLVQPDQPVLDLPIRAYEGLSWSKYHPETLIHVCYQYQDQTYRIVFSQNQDLTILTTNLNWLEEGFHNGIHRIESNLSDQSELWELMHQYGGPLGDFYDEAKIEQTSRGFFNSDMTGPLLNSSENQKIEIFNILGESRKF